MYHSEEYLSRCACPVRDDVVPVVVAIPNLELLLRGSLANIEVLRNVRCFRDGANECVTGQCVAVGMYPVAVDGERVGKLHMSAMVWDWIFSAFLFVQPLQMYTYARSPDDYFETLFAEILVVARSLKGSSTSTRWPN